ncbi:MAG: 30S ribosomal protein S18 [Candidatus Daviesbacteria bacterium]|nr:30S ribosomal protein S18 [Candidatus Daviesbacteria bacterium]
MVEKRIKRVISKPAVSVKEGEEVKQPSEELQKAGRPKRACLFCQSKTNPSYTDTNVLRRFVTDRAKIVPKLKSNLCSKHQRIATKQIKYARHLALFPFTPKV